jgi:hypothetical protein
VGEVLPGTSGEWAAAPSARVGETVHVGDPQGRVAVECLPCPLEERDVRFVRLVAQDRREQDRVDVGRAGVDPDLGGEPGDVRVHHLRQAGGMCVRGSSPQQPPAGDRGGRAGAQPPCAHPRSPAQAVPAGAAVNRTPALIRYGVVDTSGPSARRSRLISARTVTCWSSSPKRRWLSSLALSPPGPPECRIRRMPACRGGQAGPPSGLVTTALRRADLEHHAAVGVRAQVRGHRRTGAPRADQPAGC